MQWSQFELVQFITIHSALRVLFLEIWNWYVPSLLLEFTNLCSSACKATSHFIGLTTLVHLFSPLDGNSSVSYQRIGLQQRLSTAFWQWSNSSEGRFKQTWFWEILAIVTMHFLRSLDHCTCQHEEIVVKLLLEQQRKAAVVKSIQGSENCASSPQQCQCYLSMLYLTSWPFHAISSLLKPEKQSASCDYHLNYHFRATESPFCKLRWSLPMLCPMLQHNMLQPVRWIVWPKIAVPFGDTTVSNMELGNPWSESWLQSENGVFLFFCYLCLKNSNLTNKENTFQTHFVKYFPCKEQCSNKSWGLLIMLKKVIIRTMWRFLLEKFLVVIRQNCHGLTAVD